MMDFDALKDFLMGLGSFLFTSFIFAHLVVHMLTHKKYRDEEDEHKLERD